jgi:Fur family peroxide stress response transcriptional regulator
MGNKAGSRAQGIEVADDPDTLGAGVGCGLSARRRLAMVFRERKVRITRQRELLYESLRACVDHPTADELHRRVLGHDAEISLATVYNTLEILTDVGLCRRLPGAGNGPDRFDADESDHVHLTLADGRVIDLPEELGRKVLSGLSAEIRAELSRLVGHELPSIRVTLTAR